MFCKGVVIGMDWVWPTFYLPLYLLQMYVAAGHAVKTAHQPFLYQHPHNLGSSSVMTRKVASAPPPQTYTGFSSVRERGHISRPFLRDEKKKPSFVSAGVSRASGVRQPAMQTTLSSHSSALEAAVRPRQPFRSRSTIAPSSWRAGKELADRALGREKKPRLPSPFTLDNTSEMNHHDIRDHSSLLSHTNPSLRPSLSVHVPTMQPSSVAREHDDNATGMLMDLELSSEEEEEEQEEEDGADAMHQPSLTSQVRRAMLEEVAG